MSLPRLQLYRYPVVECTSLGFVLVHEKRVETWQAPNLEDYCFDISFEQALERLSQLPRLYAEPDGSFVWCGADSVDSPWQLYGMVYDRSDRVVRIELCGDCPRTQWLQLLDCLHPMSELIAFVVESQKFVLARDLTHLLTA